MKNIFVIEGCMFVELARGTWSPDDKPEQINEWFQLITDKDMAEVKHPVSADLYNKLSLEGFEYGDSLDVTYPLKIVKGKLALGKAVAVKKSSKK